MPEEKTNKYAMNLQELVEEKVNEIWKEHIDQPFCEIPPLSVKNIPEHGIIFIGINPSLDDKNRERLLNGNSLEIEFYNLKQDGQKNHRYFKKFAEIGEELKLPWGHFDLLYIRETQQSKVQELMAYEKGLDFIFKQLMVTKEVIDNLLQITEPIIFVVNNTLARRFLGKDKNESENLWMNYDFEWSPEHGTYFLKQHPFFFTSMLTGQRALDNGSYERLIWHINYVKEKIEKACS